MEQHVVEEYHMAMVEALVEKEVVVPLQQTPRNMEKRGTNIPQSTPLKQCHSFTTILQVRTSLMKFGICL